MRYLLHFKIIVIGLIILKSTFVSGQVLNANADASFKALNDSYLLSKGGLTLYRANLGNDAFDGTWTLAIDIQSAEDVYERTGLQKDKDIVAGLCRDFLVKERPPYTWDGWNDDLAWMGLFLARGSQMTGVASHLTIAKNDCFDLAFNRGWDTTFNDGGIWEEQPNYSNDGATTNKEALSNHPNGHLACLIYQETGNKEYLDKALLIHSWSKAHLFDAKTGRVYNGISPDGTVNLGTPVYNYGTYIDFLVSLYQITGDEQLIRDAILSADYVVNNLANNNGIIDNTAAYLDSWAGEFGRGLGHLCKERPELWKKYYPFLKKNSDAAWANRRKDLNLTWNGWDTPTPEDAGVKVTKYVSTVALLQHTPIVQNPMVSVEAESYNYMKEVTFVVDGANKYAENIDKDDWLDYIVDVPDYGNYTITFDVAATSLSSFNVQVNHKTVQTVQVPNTGSLQTIQKVNVGVKLEKGIQSIRILGISGVWRLDKWIATVSPTITPSISINDAAAQAILTAKVAVGTIVKLSPQTAVAGTWAWSGPNGFTATTREITIANIQFNQGGNYIVAYTNPSGLISTQKYTISLTGCIPTEISASIMVNKTTFTSDKVTVEAGSYVQIKPQATDGTWSWVGPNNFVANTAEISFNSIGYKQGGIYTATYLNSNGCESTKSFKITLTGADPCGTAINPYVNVTGWKNATSALVANGGSIQFGPQAGDGGTWSWAGPNGFTVDSREFTINGFGTDKQGIYTATYTNNQGCKSTLDFPIGLEGCKTQGSILPIIKVGTNDWYNIDNIILESGQDLSITFPNAVGSINWIRPSGQKEYSDKLEIKKITSYSSGNYVFYFVDANACSSSYAVHVEVVKSDYCSNTINPYMNVANGGWENASTGVFNVGDRIEFGPQIEGSSEEFRWTWTFNGIVLQTGKNSRSLVLNNMKTSDAGIYHLATTNSVGCKSYMNFYISNSSCPATTISPYLKINSNAMQNISSASMTIGESVTFSPQTINSGSWTWKGPNGFLANTREITLVNTKANQYGTYKVTNTNDCGVLKTLDFVITTNTLSVNVPSVTSKESFSMYPNPSSGAVTIELSNEPSDSISIYSVTGILVFSKQINNENKLEIDLRNILRTGVYFVTIKSGTNRTTKKLIIK